MLGKHGIVDNDLRYRYTGGQLREMLLEMPGCDREKTKYSDILNTHVSLMEDLGIPADYRRIDGRTVLEVDGGDTPSYSFIS